MSNNNLQRIERKQTCDFPADIKILRHGGELAEQCTESIA